MFGIGGAALLGSGRRDPLGAEMLAAIRGGGAPGRSPLATTTPATTTPATTNRRKVFAEAARDDLSDPVSRRRQKKAVLKSEKKALAAKAAAAPLPSSHKKNKRVVVAAPVVERVAFCSGCHQPVSSGECNCGDRGVYGDDGWSKCSSNYLYNYMYGYTDEAAPPLFVLSAAENNWVRLSALPANTLLNAELQLGIVEGTVNSARIGQNLIFSGLTDASFNTTYTIVGLPADSNGSYLLQPYNLLDAPCYAPIVGDYARIRHGLSTGVYQFTAIDACSLDVELVPTSVESVNAAIPVYITCDDLC